jgi:hypothetical protein
MNVILTMNLNQYMFYEDSVNFIEMRRALGGRGRKKEERRRREEKGRGRKKRDRY